MKRIEIDPMIFSGWSFSKKYGLKNGLEDGPRNAMARAQFRCENMSDGKTWLLYPDSIPDLGPEDLADCRVVDHAKWGITS